MPGNWPLTCTNVVGDTGIEPVTSSVSGKRSPAELNARGGSGNRTRVQGFAGPCLSHSATPPDCSTLADPTGPNGPSKPPNRFRADDGIRTRDPHLGKVMRYQLRYVRAPEVSFSVLGASSMLHGRSP